MRGKKEEIVICDLPQSLIDLIAGIAILTAVAVGGYFLFTTEGAVRAVLLATGAGIATFFGTIIIGAILIAITTIFYRGWDKRFSSQAEYEAWKAQKKEVGRQREEERERKRKEVLARQEELRRARERKLHQVKKKSTRLIAEMEADSTVASILRDARQRASKDTRGELLTKADITIAGIGGWLTEQGVANQLPGHWLGGVAKGKIGEHFSSLSPKERMALQKHLPRVTRVLEEALEVMSPRKVVKEILLPLFSGETENQTQDE